MKINNLILSTLLTLTFVSFVAAQDYTFEILNQVKTTSTKDQGRTGTCWSFSTTSFIETEALRQEKGEFDLSEIYFVRTIYPKKAARYVLQVGDSRFSAGGLAHDVIFATTNYGAMPENIYNGLNNNAQKHNHFEMDAMLDGMLRAAIAQNKTLSQTGYQAIEAVLDVYLGKIPTGFIYEEQYYTPTSFLYDKLGFNPHNYIEITSFTDAPFYESFVLDIPDNWSKEELFNVPLDDLLHIIDNALQNGYSITWDGDVSEEEFMHQRGIAILPAKAWNDKNAQEKNLTGTTYEPELNVTQQIRQQAFEDQTTTDDHLMHIVGIAQDSRGTKYYYTKNSWGASSNDHNGYLYMSEQYVRMKTVSILVHKDVIPKKIAKKLGI